MTKDASFKKVVRRHAQETGQRYAEALPDLEGLGAWMGHEPVAEWLLAHLRDRYGIDAFAATRLSVHKIYVVRIDHKDGALLGRLHALPYDDSTGRPGGASGEDPSCEGTPRQDLLAALAFLDAVDMKVPDGERQRFERLRNKVRLGDDGYGLPEGLRHGNLLHAPDHAVLTEQGPVAMNWKASGRGPRLADLACLIWGTGSWNPRRPNQERIDAVNDGVKFGERWLIRPPGYFSETATATRAAFRL